MLCTIWPDIPGVKKCHLFPRFAGICSISFTDLQNVNYYYTARAHLAVSYNVLTWTPTQFSCTQIYCKNLIAYPFRVLHFYTTLAHVLSSAWLFYIIAAFMSDGMRFSCLKILRCLLHDVSNPNVDPRWMKTRLLSSEETLRSSKEFREVSKDVL